MYGITDVGTYLIGTIAIITLPGPNSMYCLAISAQQGIKAAYRAVAAILLGDIILMLATILGAGTVLKLYPALFHGIKLLGGIYLAYIGWNLLRAAAKKWRFRPSENISAAVPNTVAVQSVFRRALLLSLTNPKAILFFLSFFVQFVDPVYPYPALTFLILAIVLQIVSFTYLSVLILAGSQLVQVFRQHSKISAWGMGLVGMMFIGFAVRMWTAVI
ncbi:membrane protein [Neisseria arctica]|uniref:Membrane protein n=2 Tax=Neisseria arctica TaxID=1470200 RepID=A0A0J0YS92_9NEIS|nr:leucine efflux protein LeuE [Neisseria arctica]KLT72996.1 membrane protein [Neisseria arctica]UOO87758.1 leucine efflux protein LeuE [Neisseria arctica]